MADPQAKLPANVPGPFYVDEACIDCDVCREIAPQVFRQQSVDGYSFVYRQPVTEAEIVATREAIEECPVEAIGEDG